LDSVNGQLENSSPVNQETSAARPGITPAMMLYLKQTKPWVRFISVMLFIGTVLVFLLGLVLILGAGLLSSLSRTVFGGAPLGLLGFIYAAMACLYFFPALYLCRYASGIRNAITKDQVGGVEEALKNQRSFWRFLGIILLIVLILQIAAILFFVFFALRLGTRAGL
jgi:uncharacterized BrkB/YihY/UPF0761 family membrane protein